MKQFLNDLDRTSLDKSIAEAESLTKAQIVLAAIKRCDNYPEIPWKAFAFGASLAGIIMLLYDFFVFGWITNIAILLSIAVILANGLFFVLLTILIPGFARLFLSKSRKEAETFQYAESLFLSKELFLTEGRRGILLLVSQFERQVIILPDKGVRDQLSVDVMKNTISKMTKFLKQNEVRKAFEMGLNEFIGILNQTEYVGPAKNELSDEIIEEEGV